MSEPSDEPGWAADEADRDDRDELAQALSDHLAATAELPVDRQTGRWLGEAEAVAGDLAEGLPPTAAERRAAQIVRLLDHVEETESAAVDSHVAAARRLAARVRSLAAEELADG